MLTPAKAPAAFISLLLLSACATTGGPVINTISPVQLETILEAEGADLTLTVTDGDATLRSWAGEPMPEPKADEPLPFEVFFYGCDGGAFAAPASPDSKCQSFEFRGYAYGIYQGDNTEIANSWNEIHHLGKSWRDAFGDLAIQMGTVVEGGVTPENIRAAWRRWLLTSETFRAYLQAEVI